MALDNVLCIKTNKDLMEVKSWLLEYLDYEYDKKTDYLLKKGLVAHLRKYDKIDGREKDYGLSPTIIIYFRLNKFDEFEDGYRNQVETIMHLLDYLATEAILYDSGGTVKLIFKDEKLVLQKGSWTEKNLLLIDRAYHIQEIEDI